MNVITQTIITLTLTLTKTFPDVWRTYVPSFVEIGSVVMENIRDKHTYTYTHTHWFLFIKKEKKKKIDYWYMYHHGALLINFLIKGKVILNTRCSRLARPWSEILFCAYAASFDECRKAAHAQNKISLKLYISHRRVCANENLTPV